MEESIETVIHMADLTRRLLRDDINPEQLNELRQWLAKGDHHQRYLSNLFTEKELDEYALAISKYQKVTADSITAPGNTAETTKFTIRRLISWAAIIAVTAGLVYFSVIQIQNNVEHKKREVASNIEVLPGTNRAILTLGNGSRHDLNDSADVNLSTASTKIQQHHGTLSYQPTGKFGASEYNVLTTPKGGQWHLQLADGSEVWLNAASTIRYPAAFTGRSRQVEISGEAYFNIKTSPSAPFIVKAPHTTITVLGTSFNVNAYAYDSVVRTTLISGAVNVSAAGQSQNVRPGSQAATTTTTLVIQPANINTTTAWKEGFFQYDHASLQNVMRDLENWYDVSVIFDKDFGDMPHFNGKISRNIPLAKILDMISETQIATFKLDGRTIRVFKMK